MLSRGKARAAVALSGVLSVLLACATAAQSQPGDENRRADATKPSAANNLKPKKDAKPLKGNVWNLDGGIFFATDGSLPGGTCFRIMGNAGAPEFFHKLKRVDNGDGTRFVRDGEEVTQFPAHLFVALRIFDIPCSPTMGSGNTAPALTRETMSTLRLQLFWKNGVNLRPADNPVKEEIEVKPVEPYSTTAKDLHQRFIWTYWLAVKTAEVPLTDSLVFVVETPDGKVAARVAARL